MENLGKYIAFEGVEGCGKSIQSRLAYTALGEMFPERHIVLTREPGGSEIADAIRKVVQGTPFNEEMSPICEAYLYAASRAHTLRTVVRPVVESGGIVISDRSFYTSLAIQGGARGLGVAVIMDINYQATKDCRPDKVLWIDTDPKTCHKRVHLAHDISDDKFEALGLDFFEEVRKGYLAVEKIYGDVERIPGDGSIEKVHGLVMESILKLLGEP